MKYTSVQKPVHKMDDGLQRYFVNIFTYMGLGLALTMAIFSVIAFSSPETRFSLMALRIPATFGALGIGLFFSFRVMSIRVTTAHMLFWAYCALLGVSSSLFFSMFSPMAVIKAFGAASILFMACALYGYTTKRDVLSLGSFLFVSAVSVFITSLINFFLGSTLVQMILAALSIPISLGFTAYNIKFLKTIYYQFPQDDALREKIGILGALSLYTSVINLVESLLTLFFGDRR